MSPGLTPGDLVGAFASLPFQSRAFLLVTTAVALLVAASLVLSAYAVWLRLRNALHEKTWLDRESRWTQLTLEVVSGERTDETLISRVGARERVAFLDFLLRYARRLRGRERERIKEMAQSFLPALGKLLRSPDVYRRARAVQTLSTLGTGEQAEILLEALKDESPFVSMLAARALATYGGAAYAAPILADLPRFERWGPEYVISLLVSLGPRAAPGLREIVEDAEEKPAVRALAADALRELHDLDAVDSAVRVLRGAVDPDVAAALLRLLRVLGGPDQLEAVLPRLEDPHFAVRAAAYSAMGAMSAAGEEPPLARGLADPSPWVALHAARALRHRGESSRLRAVWESGGPGASAAGQVLAEGLG